MDPCLNRRAFLRIAGGAGMALSAHGAQPTRPNIVYVFGDQHRNSSWSGGDDPQVITPNLARMAREGGGDFEGATRHALRPSLR